METAGLHGVYTYLVCPVDAAGRVKRETLAKERARLAGLRRQPQAPLSEEGRQEVRAVPESAGALLG
jgi:hypothetical protein